MRLQGAEWGGKNYLTPCVEFKTSPHTTLGLEVPMHDTEAYVEH